MKIYEPKSPRITANNAIIIFNIYIRILMKTKDTTTNSESLKTPYLTYWKTQFEKTTGLNFEHEVTKMVQKLKRPAAISLDSGSKQWGINNERKFDDIFMSLLKYFERDHDGNYLLAGYGLSNEIIVNILDLFEDEFDRRGISLFEDDDDYNDDNYDME